MQTMFRPHPPLLARMRRHRGFWALALLVLLIKLTSSTLCMADGLGGRVATVAATAMSQTVATATDQAYPQDDDTCVLGEAGGCHCACAHATTLPSTATLVVDALNFRAPTSTFETTVPPTPTPTLLRPPIA